MPARRGQTGTGGGGLLSARDVRPVEEATRTPTNTAAWFGGGQGRLEVLPAPYTRPLEGEIVVKNHAVAINPTDWMMPFTGKLIFP